jgi:phenylacetate-CoA ligase
MSIESVYSRSPAWAQTLMLNAHALRIDRHRYGAPYREAVRRLLEQERWERDALDEYQDERIRVVVEAAYARSPYYRSLLDEHGIRPSDIRGRSDLPRLPVLTKDALRSRGAEVCTSSKPRPGWLHGHTSGTTGSPLSLWYDRNTCVMTNAVDRRQKAWGGMSDTDWIGVFLGRTIASPGQTRPPFWRANRVHRQLWFSSFHMTDENLDLYVDEIRRRGIHFLEGYPSTLFILAQHVVRRGGDLPMRAVFTSSETLHELQRETIEAAFGCRIFDFYGHAERTIFAAECEAHAGKHLAEEFGYTEVVDENDQPVPEGEVGYLVGTSLHNTAMPMIRYRTGDLSAMVREPCECGRTLVRIRDVATKAEDIVVTPDGRMISPSILTHPFKPFDQIIKSQLIQDRPDHLLVKIVPSAEFLPSHEQALRERLQERLPGMTLDIAVVEDIPRERSGKFRWVISRVDHACRFAWAAGNS